MNSLTSEQLRGEAIHQMADAVDVLSKERARLAGPQSRSSNSQRRWWNSKAPPSAPYPRVDRNAIRRHAARLQDQALSITPRYDELKQVSQVAADYCRLLQAPGAVRFTTLWFEGRRLEGETMDSENLPLLIGAAAAAIVVTIVVLVRRGHTVRRSRTGGTLEPSRDFKSLLKVASEDTEAGIIARTLQEQSKAPWSWRLAAEIQGLEPGARRTLLARFHALELSDVSLVQPPEGSRFDAGEMVSQSATTNDDVWVVVETSSRGFKVEEEVVEKALVRTVTWDSHVLLDKGCSVGRLLRERADDLVPGGAAGMNGWRATWGLSNPEDLRELVDEATLQTWRKRMVEAVNAKYPNEDGRKLTETGQKGAVFERSTMEVEGDEPLGDASVELVITRDGIPQHGLACPGGSPLLLAVVKTTSVTL